MNGLIIILTAKVTVLAKYINTKRIENYAKDNNLIYKRKK